MKREQLKAELETIFDAEFFPATSSEIYDYLQSSDCATDDLLDYIGNLVLDINFKYNSIDDILPQEKYVDYPFYTKDLDSFFHKILSEHEAVYIVCSESLGYKLEIHMTPENVRMWSLSERISEDLFNDKYREVLNKINEKI